MARHRLLVSAIVAIIAAYKACRNRHTLTRKALVHPQLSPWSKLLRCGDDGDFIEVTGLSRTAFGILHRKLFPVDMDRNSKVGRKRLLNTLDELGMYLHFTNSTMKLKTICQLFGVTPSTASVAIKRIRRRVCRRLLGDPDCCIRWPTPAEQEHFSRLIQQREPLLPDQLFGFVDGCSFPCATADDADVQNAYYNGWKSGTYVNNVFVFSPTGKIIFASINAPGSWHDAALCGDLYELLLDETKTTEGLAIVADTAFPRSGPLARKIVAPTEFDTVSHATNVAIEEIKRHQLIVSLRQAAEWGMRALQGTFGRLKTQLTSHNSTRFQIILSIVLLHNFRTKYVGLNQITSVFSDDYEEALRDRNYDRIARYYNV